MPHHDLLPLESLVAAPLALLAALGLFNISEYRLRDRFRDVGVCVVEGTAGLLLCHHGQGVSDHRSASSHRHAATNTIPNASTHAAAHTSSHTAGPTFGPCGSFQLRCGCRKHLGRRQEGVVLPDPSSRVPSHCATTTTHCATSAANLATSPANLRPTDPASKAG